MRNSQRNAPTTTEGALNNFDSNTITKNNITKEKNNTTLPKFLEQEEYIELVKNIPASSNQFKRMVTYLAFNPDTITTQLCIETASVNLSDLAKKNNHLIRPKGFVVACRKPPYSVSNRFGERSNQFLWGLYPIGGEK